MQIGCQRAQRGYCGAFWRQFPCAHSVSHHARYTYVNLLTLRGTFDWRDSCIWWHMTQRTKPFFYKFCRRLVVAGVGGLMLAMSAVAQDAGRFYPRDHIVLDLTLGLEWLRCSAGQQWNGETCVGSALRLTFAQAEDAIVQANDQIGPGWRFPTRAELSSLICKDCAPPKINGLMFPGTLPEAYWTGQKPLFLPRNRWTVNFFTGHSYARFFADQPMALRLVRARVSN